MVYGFFLGYMSSFFFHEFSRRCACRHLRICTPLHTRIPALRNVVHNNEHMNVFGWFLCSYRVVLPESSAEDKNRQDGYAPVQQLSLYLA